ncbi:MAG: SH3 domain-containing protein [Pseudomonadota bacterium]
MRAGRFVTIGLIALLAAAPALAQRKLPYFGSISAGKARMRVGPGREYPSSWLYQRADLPVKVVEVYKGWKKIEDPDGTQGWMQANLLSETRTALVIGQIAELRDAPRIAARVQWRAAPGVVGRVSRCNRGWCWFDIRGRAGWVEAGGLWGVAAGEVLG